LGSVLTTHQPLILKESCGLEAYKHFLGADKEGRKQERAAKNAASQETAIKGLRDELATTKKRVSDLEQELAAKSERVQQLEEHVQDLEAQAAKRQARERR